MKKKKKEPGDSLVFPGIFLLNAEGEMGTGTESNVALPLNARDKGQKNVRNFVQHLPHLPGSTLVVGNGSFLL